MWKKILLNLSLAEVTYLIQSAQITKGKQQHTEFHKN